MRLVLAVAAAVAVTQSAPQGARISGRVTDSLSGRPLAGVRLALRPDARGNVRTLVTLSTDREGRYEILNVSPGRYVLEPSIAGYVLLGPDRNPIPGRPFELRGREPSLVVDFSVSATSSMIVQVTDDRGEPMADVPVLLEPSGDMPVQPSSVTGDRAAPPPPAARRQGTTNDTGEVTLLEIAPGDYHVSAIPNSGRSPIRIQTNQADEAFVRTYYPGVKSLLESPIVPVPPGQQLRATVRLQTVRLSAISGTAVSSGGKPLSRGIASLVPRKDVPMNTSGPAQGRQVPLAPDGSFELTGVIPAEYVLMVSSLGRGAESESGSVLLSVVGEDISNLRIVTASGAPGIAVSITPVGPAATIKERAGATIRGRVLVAGSGEPLRRAIVSLGTTGTGFSNPSMVATADDGQYEFAGLSQGRYRVKVQKSGYATVAYGENENQREPEVLIMGPGEQRDDVDIRMSGGCAMVVTVTSGGGPARGVRVQVSRRGEAHELITVADSRRTDDRGELRIGALPPGTYYVGAVNDGGTKYAQMIYFPGVLLFADAEPIVLGAGQETSISMTLASPPGN